MARPTLLTDSIREELEEALAAGVPVRIAAASVGVSRPTVYEWLSRGLVERRQRLRVVEEKEQPVEEDPAAADAQIEAALVGAVMKSAETDWRAARAT